MRVDSDKLPDHNVTGVDYADRGHFRYRGHLIDIHAHVVLTRATDPPKWSTKRRTWGNRRSSRVHAGATADFGVLRTYSMCLPEDIPILRERFGEQIAFNGPIQKKLDEPDEAAYKLLDQYLEQEVEIIKFWAAPRGRDRGLFVDTPWRIEAGTPAQAAGVRIVMVHGLTRTTGFALCTRIRQSTAPRRINI